MYFLRQFPVLLIGFNSPNAVSSVKLWLKVILTVSLRILAGLEVPSQTKCYSLRLE